MTTRKSIKPKNSKKKIRKIRSKRQRGGGGVFSSENPELEPENTNLEIPTPVSTSVPTVDIKLAILLITTHGNVDSSEPTSIHDFDINIRKVNATIPGVCNFIEDGELLEMGNEMSRFIELNKEQWLTDGILKPSSGLNLQFKSVKMAQRRIDDLSKSLRSFIQRIDGVRKETVKTATSKRKVEPRFMESKDTHWEPAASKYRDNIDKGYQLEKWDQGDEYLDKIYTIISDERSDTTSNPYNNTVLFLGETGMPDSSVIDIPYNSRSNKAKGDTQMRLSEILEDLTEKGYTDTIIIDLSCSAGFTDTDSRNATYSYKRGEVMTGKAPYHIGGKKRKPRKTYRKTSRKRKTRKTSRKTSRKRKSKRKTSRKSRK